MSERGARDLLNDDVVNLAVSALVAVASARSEVLSSEKGQIVALDSQQIVDALVMAAALVVDTDRAGLPDNETLRARCEELASDLLTITNALRVDAVPLLEQHGLAFSGPAGPAN